MKAPAESKELNKGDWMKEEPIKLFNFSSRIDEQHVADLQEEKEIASLKIANDTDFSFRASCLAGSLQMVNEVLIDGNVGATIEQMALYKACADILGRLLNNQIRMRHIIKQSQQATASSSDDAFTEDQIAWVIDYIQEESRLKSKDTRIQLNAGNGRHNAK